MQSREELTAELRGYLEKLQDAQRPEPQPAPLHALADACDRFTDACRRFTTAFDEDASHEELMPLIAVIGERSAEVARLAAAASADG